MTRKQLQQISKAEVVEIILRQQGMQEMQPIFDQLEGVLQS